MEQAPIRFVVPMLFEDFKDLLECWCTQNSGEESKNLPFQRTRWRFAARSEFCLAMSGSVVSSFAGLVAEVAGVDAAARLVNLVAEVAGADTGVRLRALATGVDTGVLFGVRGTLFGVDGGDP